MVVITPGGHMGEVVTLYEDLSPSEKFRMDLLDLIFSEPHGELSISETIGVMEMVKHSLIEGCP